MKICIGGTFDILHKGHKTLLKEAFKEARGKGTVFIGVTSGDFVNKKDVINSLESRIKNLRFFLEKNGLLHQSIIKPISNKYGPTLTQDFDVLIVSPETYNTAEEINIKRAEMGKKPMKIVKVQYVLAEDGEKISSSRIKNKEIDEEGRVIVKD